MINKIINEIKQEYLKDSNPWIIGYSGGKDSSTVVKLVFLALRQLETYHKKVTIIYCDTNIENPIINNYAKKILKNLREECLKYQIPINIKILTHSTKNSFWVKIIGKGYPTPTYKFRWCTDRLRINPINEYIKLLGQKQQITILLGVRKQESRERNKTINKNVIAEKYLKQTGNKKAIIYSPIINFDLSDIWKTLLLKSEPFSINGDELLKIYNDASCQFQEFENESKYGNARFGCWVCTVVRKDKSMINLIKSGHEELIPFLDFRSWILSIRDNPKYRNKKICNGRENLGAFNLKARKLILKNIKELEKKLILKS